MKIGARIYKTAIAVVISIILGSFLNEQAGFFAAIAAIITMQSTFRGSFTKGKERVLGTIFGACIGYIFALIYHGNPFLIGVGIILIIYVCRLLKWENAIVIACVVFMSIMLNIDQNVLSDSIFRIVDTSSGIIIALLVNYFIKPPKPLSLVYKECALIFNELSKNIDQILYENLYVDLDLLHGKILDLKKKYNVHEYDVFMNNENEDDRKRLNEIIEGLLTIYEHLRFIDELKKSESIFVPSNILDNSIEQKKLLNIILEFHSQLLLKEWGKVKALWKARRSL